MATAGVMVAYAMALQLVYCTVISPTFSYLGETYRRPDAFSVGISILLVAWIAVTMPRQCDRPSEFVLWVLYLTAVAPSILVAQYADILRPGSALVSSILMALIFQGLILVNQAVQPLASLHIGVPAGLLAVVAAVLTVITTAALLYSGASFSLVGLTDVRDLRISYKSTVAAIPFVGYLLQLQTAVLNPLFISLGMLRNRLALICIGAAGQVLIYSVTGYKLTVLSPLFIIVLALAFRRSRLTGYSLSAGMCLTILLSSLLDFLLSSALFVTVFVNRLIAIPGVLTSAYLSVFENRPKYVWSYSFLSSFTDSPYQLTPGYLVGRLFQGMDAQANASLLGDGYANLGWAGVIIEAAFLLVVLFFLDSAAAGLPARLIIPATLVAALGLGNNSPFSSILTGGLGGLIAALACCPRGSLDTITATDLSSASVLRSPSRGTRKERHP